MASVSSASKRSVRHTVHNAALRLYSEGSLERITLRDLADAARVPAGAVVTNVSRGDLLLEAIAADMLADHYERVTEVLRPPFDPAVSLATRVRCTVQRAAVQPAFGRFIAHFSNSLSAIEIAGHQYLGHDLENGFEMGRFLMNRAHIPSLVSTILGVTAGALDLLHFGLETWERAGSDAAEFSLCALGLLRSDARVVATLNLPEIGLFDEADLHV